MKVFQFIRMPVWTKKKKHDVEKQPISKLEHTHKQGPCLIIPEEKYPIYTGTVLHLQLQPTENLLQKKKKALALFSC